MQGCQRCIHTLYRLLSWCAAHQRQKFISAQAAEHIAFLQHAAHCLCNGNEQLVPGSMPEMVIGLFQVVHIKHAKRERFACSGACSGHLRQRGLSRASVQRARQFVGGCRNGELMVFRYVQRMLKVDEPAIVPLNQAVEVFIDAAVAGIMFLPAERCCGRAVPQQTRHGAEGTAPAHPFLKHLPADFSLRLHKAELLFHAAVHKQDLVRVHIGDINACVHLVHDPVQKPNTGVVSGVLAGRIHHKPASFLAQCAIKFGP